MKTISAARTETRTWLDRHIHAVIATPPTDAPVKSVALNPPSRITEQTWPDVRQWAQDWFRTELPPETELPEEKRQLSGTRQPVPTHLRFHAVTAAAAFAADGWPRQLQVVERRWETLTILFPTTATRQLLHRVRAWPDTDFDLGCTAAQWFADPSNDWSELTPRQVPIEGLHSKWLNSHQRLVQALAGLENLDLATRPTRINFTYLDPTYRATGHRLHDSQTIGDNVDLPYQPTTIVILENKDTAVLFPPLPGAIAVEGNGNTSPGVLPHIPWITTAHKIIYWGDIDARGYEIINSLRKNLSGAGATVDVTSILMDPATYDTYEPYGTNTDEHDKRLRQRERRPLPFLTPAERQVYTNLTDPSWTRNLRIEQERIPLRIGLDHVKHCITEDRQPSQVR